MLPNLAQGSRGDCPSGHLAKEASNVVAREGVYVKQGPTQTARARRKMPLPHSTKEGSISASLSPWSVETKGLT